MNDQSLPSPTPWTEDAPEAPVPTTGDLPSAEVNYKEPGEEMKLRYKFFQFSIINEREEIKFTEDFEGWEFVGMCNHGARVVVLGKRFLPVQEAVVQEAPIEIAHLGELGSEVDEREVVASAPVEQVNVVNPFK